MDRSAPPTERFSSANATFSPLEKRLRPVVVRGRVLTSPAQLAGYDADGLGYKRFRPDAVAIPADLDELLELVRAAATWDVPVILRGAGTSLAGGPVAAQGGLVVHTSSLRQIRQIDPDGLWCEVECGVTLKQLEDALRPHSLFYPPDPSSGIVCTLGGNVAMNAGGAHCFRHGVTGNYVLGVEVILPDGSVHRFGGPAGGTGPWQLDWKRLMVGSEGTLGTFTRFWLRLLPLPAKAWTFRATFADLATAEAAIHALVAHVACPVAIELMDPRFVQLVENSPMAVGLPTDSFVLIAEIDGPETWVDHHVESVAQAIRQAGATDLSWSDDSDDRDRLWKARKVAGGLMGQLSPDFVVQDAVIPKSALAATLDLIYCESDAAGISVINVFHAGDGNLHPNFLFDSRQPEQLAAIQRINKRLMRWVIEVGGTLSGEHGIGNDKTEYMPLVFDNDALRLQYAIPALFNPNHQWNPLKVFKHRRFHPAKETNASETTNTEPHATELPATEPTASEKTPSASPPRRFSHFCDWVDAVVCVSADVTPAELAKAIGTPTLRCPLVENSSDPLRAQIAAGPYAAASSRFGPWCDNVIGMNWRLPSGRIVRLGERVVKSTTGYDLLRFFLHSGDRFGEPVDYVLRLRPALPLHAMYRLTGSIAQLNQAIRFLRRSPWGLWFDRIDDIHDSLPTIPDNAAAPQHAPKAPTQSPHQLPHRELQLVANVADRQTTIHTDFVDRLALDHGLVQERLIEPNLPPQSLPDRILKVTPDQATQWAHHLVSQQPSRCHAQPLTGAILQRLPPTATPQPLSEHHQTQLQSQGATHHTRHATLSQPTPTNSPESTWQTALHTALPPHQP